MSVAPVSHYTIAQDPFFAALNSGSASAPGAVAPQPGFKTYAEQDAQLRRNVNNFLINYTYESFAGVPSAQAQSYAPGSSNALVQSLFQFGNDLSAAAGQLAALGSTVNTRA